MKKQIEDLRANMEDKIGGNAPLDVHNTPAFELSNCTVHNTLDDILMLQYVDVSESGKEVMRNGLFVSLNVTEHVWRIAKVLLAGPNCKTVKEGDHVIFPNDRGIRASEVNNLKNIVFISEQRIFGVCTLNG